MIQSAKSATSGRFLTMIPHLVRQRTAYLVLAAFACIAYAHYTHDLRAAAVSLTLFIAMLVDYSNRYRIWPWPNFVLVIIAACVLVVGYWLFAVPKSFYTIPLILVGVHLSAWSRTFH